MTINPAEPGPAVYAFLGAAFSYYGLGALQTMNCPWSFPVWIVTVLLLAVLGAVRTLVTLPLYLYADTQLRYRVRLFERYFFALVIGFFLGAAFRSAAGSEAVRRGLTEEAVTGFSGVLKTDPRQSGGGQGSAYLELETVSGSGGLRASARGRMAIFFSETAFPRIKGIGRGSRVFVEGAFFTSRGGDKGFRAASVHIMNAAPRLEQIRSRLRARVLRQIGDPRWGGLAQALLLGARDNLDADLVRTYQEAGCAHVLALSGLHLAIVSGIAAFLLNRLLGLKAAAIAGALFIFFYAALVGAQPSL